jgi:hypothetical protein
MFSNQIQRESDLEQEFASQPDSLGIIPVHRGFDFQQRLRMNLERQF